MAQPARPHPGISRRCVIAAVGAPVVPSCFAVVDPGPRIAWDAPLELARGPGLRGPWQQDQSRHDFVDDPAVALDGEGRLWAAWVDQRRKDVFLRRFDVRGQPVPGPAVNVSRSPASFSWLPRLQPGTAAGELFVVWQEILFTGGSHGGEILVSRSTDGGGQFSHPLNVSNAPSGDGKGRTTREHWDNGSLDIAAAATAVCIAWTEYDGPLRCCWSMDRGATFTRPVRVAGTDALPARAPALGFGPAAAAWLAWSATEAGHGALWLARSPAPGAVFALTQRIATARASCDAPRLAVDADGTLHLVHAERRLRTDGGWARGILYRRLAAGAGTFDRPREITGPAEDGWDFPDLRLDAAGRVVVLAERFPRAGPVPRGLGLAVSTDGGEHFSGLRPVPGSEGPAGSRNGSTQGLLARKLALGRDGVLAIGNSSFLAGVGSRVWVVRGRLA